MNNLQRKKNLKQPIMPPSSQVSNVGKLSKGANPYFLIAASVAPLSLEPRSLSTREKRARITD